MLKANKSKWFEKIFSLYNRNLIKRRFYSLRVCGLENLDEKDSDSPLITYANHSSWWDGLILFEIFSHFHLETYVLMEEKQLKDLPLFRKLGAFSIIREKPREAIKSINYAVQKLKENPKTNLWIFPQGEILPNEIRPMFFYKGLSKIVQKSSDCNLIPIALKFEFLNEYKPECFVKIGKIRRFENLSRSESKTLTKDFQSEMENLLDELKANIINKNLQKFQRLI